MASLGGSVFSKCSSLHTIDLPLNMTSLGTFVYHWCSSLSTVILPPKITTICAGVFGNCSSLTSVHLPANLTTISLLAFQGCSKLTTINAPSFSTTTFGNSPNEYKDLLVKEGFSQIKLDTILYRANDSSSSNDRFDLISDMKSWDMKKDKNCDLYYDMKSWGRKKDKNSFRLPLCTAAAKSLLWVDIGQIFAVNMPAIHEVDKLTGLPVFMLAAVGPTSDIESVYNLLKEYPSAIGFKNDIHQNASTGTTRKRGQRKFVKRKCQKL